MLYQCLTNMTAQLHFSSQTAMTSGNGFHSPQNFSRVHFPSIPHQDKTQALWQFLQKNNAVLPSHPALSSKANISAVQELTWFERWTWVSVSYSPDEFLNSRAIDYSVCGRREGIFLVSRPHPPLFVLLCPYPLEIQNLCKVYVSVLHRILPRSISTLQYQ